MATTWTPPIDLYGEADPVRNMGRDDREMGSTLGVHHTEPETHPRANGDLDGGAVEAGEQRWDSVLGW